MCLLPVHPVRKTSAITSTLTGTTMFMEHTLRQTHEPVFLESKEPCHGKKSMENRHDNRQPGEVDMPGKRYVAFSLHDHKPEGRSTDEAEEQEAPCNHDHGKRNPSR